MAIGSVLVLALRYIGVELVLSKVVKKGSARHRGGDELGTDRYKTAWA
jgi:hypothetical protein